MSTMNYLPLLLSGTFALLWLYLVTPMVSRLFGLRVPTAISKRTEVLRGVGFPRFLLLYGVFTWGMAAFTFFVSNAFFEWRFSTTGVRARLPLFPASPFTNAWIERHEGLPLFDQCSHSFETHCVSHCGVL